MIMLKVSVRKVRKVKKRLEELNLNYDDLKDMTDNDFEALFIERKDVKSLYHRLDCNYIHK